MDLSVAGKYIYDPKISLYFFYDSKKLTLDPIFHAESIGTI